MISRAKKKISILSIVILIVFSLVCFSWAKEKSDSAIGLRFHKQTSLTWLGVLGGAFGSKPKRPERFKVYPDAKKVKLPKPAHEGITVEQAIKQRRSVRDYSGKPISTSELSELLFAAQGQTGKIFGQELRSAPSAGALYPFEIYVVVNNVKDLQKGIYHYSVLDHSLELLKAGDFSGKITKAGLEQEMLGDSAVTFILTAIFDRVCCKYGERGYRYAYIEAGHISQNIYLQAVSLQLGSVSVGVFVDEGVNKLVGIDGEKEAAIYLHAVGSI